MTTPRQKANVGLTLLVLFLITLVTGIILHLKSHGILIQPRAVIKTVHWSAGFLMVVFTCWHGSQFLKMFNGMKQRFRWFWCDTWAVIILTFLTFTTGLVKLLSPVKIPHLGLWHYGIGIAMAVFIALHLVRGLPAWNRLRKLK